MSICSIICRILLEEYMTAREFVKILLAKECITLKELAQIATQKGDKKYTPDGLSHKMRLGTLRYDDAEFCKTFGYEIELRKIPQFNQD